MAEPIIAIIFDFDDTLGPDTISFLLGEYRIKPDEFWAEIKEQVKKGYDPPHVYMSRILQYVQSGVINDLTKDKFLYYQWRIRRNYTRHRTCKTYEWYIR